MLARPIPGFGSIPIDAVHEPNSRPPGSMNSTTPFAHPALSTARRMLRTREQATFEEQIRIVQIPAPTGREGARAAYVERRFHEIGLSDTHLDEVGNVLGRLPGHDGEGLAPVLISAHLDTIFPAETRIEPRWIGRRIHAPGISDNARGVSALLALATVVREASLPTRRDLWFVGSVGEEGLGDLRGIKHLFRPGSTFREAAAFIALDGAGVNRIVCGAIGSVRMRVTVRGPGGHSWGDRDLVNPVHLLSAAIEALQRLRPPSGAPFAVNVGRIEGGTSVNAVPSHAWMELDLRSGESATLAYLAERSRKSLGSALEAASAGRRGSLTLEVERIGDRPCGQTAPDHPLVRGAVAATRRVGIEPQLIASSTDANVPIALGIPALAIGAGGLAGGIHTPEEWFENRGAALGLERALLTLVAATGMHGVGQPL